MLTITGHCYLMMDNLQEAYSAYQQALYHLQDPKVGGSATSSADIQTANIPPLGTQALVWHRHPLRPLWISRARGGSFFSSHADGTQLRQGE